MYVWALWRNVIGTGFSTGASIFPYHYHSTCAPRSYLIKLPPLIHNIVKGVVIFVMTSFRVLQVPVNQWENIRAQKTWRWLFRVEICSLWTGHCFVIHYSHVSLRYYLSIAQLNEALLFLLPLWDRKHDWRLAEWLSPAVYCAGYAHDICLGEVAARSWRYRNHIKSYRTESELSFTKAVSREMISATAKKSASVIRWDL